MVEGIWVGYALIIAWTVRALIHSTRLERELEKSGAKFTTGNHWFLLFALLPWFFRKAERDWIDEQERTRNINQQLRENANKEQDIPDWVDCHCFSCTDGWPSWERQLRNDHLGRNATAHFVGSVGRGPE